MIRIIQPVNQLTSNYIVWKPGTHTDHSSVFVLTVFNYKHIPDNCLFCCDANQASGVEGTYHLNQENSGIPNMPTRSVLRLTVPLQFVVIHNCIPDATLYIPDHRLETCGRHYLYEIGFLIYSGWVLAYGQFPVKAELVEGVVVYVFANELFWWKLVPLNLHNTRDQIS